jgi:hypothetical protein
MNPAAIVMVDLAALLLVFWLFRLVRRDRLYVGYGVIFVLVTAAGAVMISVEGALDPLALVADVTVGAPALVGLALAFMFLMLIYTLSQVTRLSNRLTTLVQELAIRQAMADGADRPEPPERV